MHRIDLPSASPTLPAVAAAGPPGYFTSGNPLTGVDATIVDQDWVNAVQEEMVAIPLAAGLTLVKGDFAQVLRGLRTLFRGQTVAVFSSSVAWVVPAGVYRVKFRIWGAGGGGGGVNGPAQSSGAGGGAYSEGVANVTPGTTITITVGVGGPGGDGTPTNGVFGGATSFGAFATATGGNGGFCSGGGPQSTIGVGGFATGGTICLSGTSGSGGYASVGGGGGGGSPMGLPGAPSGSAGGSGAAGGIPGGGGGGTSSPGAGGFAGGPGGGGLVILEY